MRQWGVSKQQFALALSVLKWKVFHIHLDDFAQSLSKGIWLYLWPDRCRLSILKTQKLGNYMSDLERHRKRDELAIQMRDRGGVLLEPRFLGVLKHHRFWC